ncbi:helix-turn-helix domain-containing protein [Rhodococcus fascians]|nr:helix-turn-helix domain-containing protein [Rhodococcus fascians]MBY3824068.1 helix-turn-helix domain-containing protein [Rhodococcus fascians]MBY3834590.1 helix-turn-helix domain-containing protein [Rhodococcus fascians]MBY3863802.1 helix-turn-helix domain-containing protein [Rhodococcus fascians]MBY3883273.1 helix-turn-helix domain-containing protein [Rhodococcus fascians]
MPVPVEFSTLDLPLEERIERWEGHNADLLIGLRCRMLEVEQLEATGTNLRLDSVDLARVIGTSHVVERDAELIRQQPSDSVMMYFSLVGDAFFYSADGIRSVGPGQGLVFDADRAFMRGFSHGLEELVLKLPRSVFADVTGAAVPSEPTVLDFSPNGNVHAAALARQVGRATSRRDPTPPDERAILELVSVLTTGARADLNSAHRAAARSFIEQRLSDASLSAAQVARAVGISARHLSRVFADDATSVPKYILERRLEWAHAQLTGPFDASMTVADIALSCGFTSATYFSRSFVARFGRRASDVRRDAVITRAAG